MSAEISSTSSIGAIWPPAATTNERVRGFYPEVVSTASDARVLLDEFASAQAATEAHPTATRLSIRAVVKDEVVPVLGEILQLEAALPLAGSVGSHIIYAAWNDPNRRLSRDELDSHHSLIGQAHGRELSVDDPAAELRAKDFVPQIIDKTTSSAERDAMKGRFLGLYGKFGFDADEVDELLDNPNNTIAYISNDKGDVVSTVLAEHGTIKVFGHGDGGELSMVEITEAVTSPDARGQGLYRALSGLLVRRVVERRNGGLPLDVLYGECNLASPGVIVAAYRNGRRFSVNDAQKLGISGNRDFGILQQNVTVNDGKKIRPYNDFALTYVPLQ